MSKLLIISGPTASGKTSLGFSFAKKLNGEIISADSRQVYRGMDIVTGKDLPEISNLKSQISNLQLKTQNFRLEPRISEGIPIWLVDVVDPDESFNVADYYEGAWRVIKEIWRQGKLPILVGGTGFYIKALLDGIGTMGIAPDWKLRRRLETLTVDQLGKKLKQLDPKKWGSMNVSDRKNSRRLVRAIEVSTYSSSEAKRSREVNNSSRQARTLKDEDILWIGLHASNSIIYRRIDKRVDERLKQGAVEETNRLAKKYGWDDPSMTGQGYRELRGFIEGSISVNEAVKRWKLAEHLYARKQITWFKKEKRIIWFDITQKNLLEKVQNKVQQWYTNS